MKDKHSSSSGSKHKSKDKDRDKEHKSSSTKDKERSSDKHKSSSSGNKHKSKDRDRDRERDKHKSSSSKDKNSSSHSKPPPPVIDTIDSKFDLIQHELKIKEESPIRNQIITNDRLELSQASSCDYSLSQFKDESLPHINRNVKSESDSEEQSAKNTFVECKGEPEDSMDFENEAAPEESEEDIPLSKRKKGNVKQFLNTHFINKFF